MIETNMPREQQKRSFQHSPHTETEATIVAQVGPTTTCHICDAVYTPSPQQALFMQQTQEALEAAFMGMCHFCFRCRRAACPQCWDEVHGVCGSCVQETGLSFRTRATALDGLMFPPSARTSIPALQQTVSLFVPVKNGRYYTLNQSKPGPVLTDIITDHVLAVQPSIQTTTSDSHMTDEECVDTGASINTPARKIDKGYPTDKEQSDTPATTIPAKTSALEETPDTREQEKTPQVAKKARKASRLEVALTWIVLVILLALVVVIALAEFLPAVNVLVERVAHIDIHAEIAYLVHTVQQLFKR